MATALRTDVVRCKLKTHRPTTFKSTAMNEWQMPIDTLLQWEQWLKSDKMKLEHVKATEKKHRFIMHSMKKVSKRVKGDNFGTKLGSVRI